jgi:predicted enzyme related to lactoylglutathione lyase
MTNLCHWELMVSDVEKAKAFYRRVFDWRFDDASPEYTMIDTGKPPGGGLMAKPPSAPAAALNTYFLVDDIDRTLRNAVEAGAIVAVPKTEIPNVGWFAMFLDPDQIPIGIFKERMPRG